jgi:hypothetical protein
LELRIERVGTERKFSLIEPQLEASFTSSSSGEQEGVNDPAIPSRQLAQWSASEGPVADTMAGEDVDPQPAVAYSPTATAGPSVSNIEETLEPLSSTSSQSEPSVEELGEQALVSRSVTGRPTDKPSDIGEESLPSFVPQIRRKARANTFSKRAKPVRTPSPIPEEFVAQPSSVSTSSESLVMELKERLNEQLPSPEYVQRRVTTRKYTQPIEASPVPSSSEIPQRQSTVAPTHPLSRRATVSELTPGEERRASESASRSIAMSDPLYNQSDTSSLSEDASRLPILLKQLTRMLTERTVPLPPPSASRQTSRQHTRKLTNVLTRPPSEYQAIKSALDDVPEPQAIPLPPSRQLTRQLTEAPSRVTSQYKKLLPVREDAPEPRRKSVPVSRYLTREPSGIPSRPASQYERFESTQLEPESFDLESREELQDALVEAIGQLQAADSKAEINELTAETASLVEQLETAPEAQSRRVSRVPMVWSRRATMKNQDPSPSSSSDVLPTRSDSMPPDETYFSQSPVPTEREQLTLERNPTIPARVNTQHERGQVDNPLPRIPTTQPEPPRNVSVAPGIEVLPPRQVSGEEPATPAKSYYKKVPTYPPEEQHPPAPAYPFRKTPTWTEPDTHTPSPRRVTGTVEPNEDRPFPAAAPGGRGSPGGTLQRSESDAVRSRDYDDPVRSGPIYARKDDYYPRLTSIVPNTKDDFWRPRPAPTERPDGTSPNDARQQSFRRQTETRLDSRPHSPQAKPSFRRSSTQNEVSRSPPVQMPKERAFGSDLSSQDTESRSPEHNAILSDESSQVSSPLGRHVSRTNTESATVPSQTPSAQGQYPGPSRAPSTQVQVPSRSRVPSAQVDEGRQSKAPSRVPSAQGHYQAPSRTSFAQVQAQEQPRAPSPTSSAQVEARTQPQAPGRTPSIQAQERTDSPTLQRRDTAPITKAPTRRATVRRASEATNAAPEDPPSPRRRLSTPAEDRPTHKRSTVARTKTETGATIPGPSDTPTAPRRASTAFGDRPALAEADAQDPSRRASTTRRRPSTEAGAIHAEPNETPTPARRASTAMGDRPARRRSSMGAGAIQGDSNYPSGPPRKSSTASKQARRRSSAAKSNTEARTADAGPADFPPPLRRRTTVGDGEKHEKSPVARSNTGRKDSRVSSSRKTSTVGGDGAASAPHTRSTTPTCAPPSWRATNYAADTRRGGKNAVPQQNTACPSAAAKLGSGQQLPMEEKRADRRQSPPDAKPRRASRSQPYGYDGNDSYEANGDAHNNAPAGSSSNREDSTPRQSLPSKRSGGFFGKRKEPRTIGGQSAVKDTKRASAQEASTEARPIQEQSVAKAETKHRWGWKWGRD